MKHVTLEKFLIWAYRDQLVHKMTSASLEPIERYVDETDPFDFMPSPRDSIVMCERLGALETQIDGGGRSWVCHTDAERLHDIVSGLKLFYAIHVRRFGQQGDPPEWETAPQALVPVPVPANQPGKVRHKITVKWYRVEGRRPKIARGESVELANLKPGEWDLGCRFCPVIKSPTNEYISMVRQEYSAWHNAMTALLALLRVVRFRDHIITGFSAPARPWERTAAKAQPESEPAGVVA